MLKFKKKKKKIEREWNITDRRSFIVLEERFEIEKEKGIEKMKSW